MAKARIDILAYCGPSLSSEQFTLPSGFSISSIDLIKRCALYLASKCDSLGSYDIFTHGLMNPGVESSDWRLLLDPTSDAQSVNEEGQITALNTILAIRDSRKDSGVIFSLNFVSSSGSSVRKPTLCLVVYLHPRPIELPSQLIRLYSQLSNHHFIALVAPTASEVVATNLEKLSRAAYESHGTFNVIYLANDGVSGAPVILDRLIEKVPRAFQAALYMGHLSASITLNPDPKTSNWTNIAAKNKLPVELPRTISILGFVDASLAPNPIVVAQFDILPSSTSQHMPPLLSLLEEALKSKRKFAIVSLGSTWTALISPSTQLMSILILAPVEENFIFFPQLQSAPASPYLHVDRDGLNPDAIAFEFDQLLEAMKSLPDSGKQVFYAAEQIRIRARKLGHLALIDALAALLEEERKKIENSNMDACFVLEELIHLLTVQPQSALVFSAIDSAEQANRTSAKMSLQSILS